MRPHIIGIAGPSCSGKTELAKQLALSLPGASVVSLDSYYRSMAELPFDVRAKSNFDHPDALEWELLRGHLSVMSQGRPFDEPVYSFATHTRVAETRRIEPADFMILEGLFVLYWPALRELLDTKVYVDTGPEECFNRRMKRDVAERARTPESVREQYERTVRPGAEAFVYPTAKFADLVVSGERPLTISTAQVLAAVRKSAPVPV